MYEPGWKVLKELMMYEGKNIANTGSPREIIKSAYSVYDFIEEQIWLSMLRVRNDMACK
ncbi:MAG: HI0074 family nucleotidyltransferase substrate-binding subunit [Lachnospiraceae bacterium]|nr:HI0074 family nucleotidyltransferase substrate-binding subunit [Lachnospiraceae bacterium]